MTRKRLDRDKKWFFQHYPYFQMRMENDTFAGLVSLIQLTDGEYLYWNFLPQAGKAAVAGQGMAWLQLIPDRGSRAITAMFLPNKKVSVWYVDVIEETTFDPDGVAVFLDKYLDVILRHRAMCLLMTGMNWMRLFNQENLRGSNTGLPYRKAKT